VPPRVLTNSLEALSPRIKQMPAPASINEQATSLTIPPNQHQQLIRHPSQSQCRPATCLSQHHITHSLLLFPSDLRLTWSEVLHLLQKVFLDPAERLLRKKKSSSRHQCTTLLIIKDQHSSITTRGLRKPASIHLII
jgi:hypothetical protein